MKLRTLLAASTAIVAASFAPSQAAIVDNPHFKVLGLVIVWGADGYSGTGAAPVVSDFIIDTGSGTTAAASGDTDLISDDVYTVVTGSLTPTSDAAASASAFDVTGSTSGASGSTDSNSDGVLDASDTFSKFGIDASTDVALDSATLTSSFYVASNTAFAIDAVASTVTSDVFTLADVGFEMEVTRTGTDGALAFGSAAQFPHSGGATGGVAAVDSLDDMATAVNVFTGNQRTASSAGSIAAQSVRFDVTYTLGGVDGYDLSMGAGEIEADVTYTVFVP